MGDQFTVADAYLFTILNWTKVQSLDLGQWPNVKTYVERVAARPKVQEAIKAEGLLKAAWQSRPCDPARGRGAAAGSFSKQTARDLSPAWARPDDGGRNDHLSFGARGSIP
jgi:hypothetical protein